MSLRCLIIDDNAYFLVAARSVLESQGIEVVGVAESAAEALQQAEALCPDVALVDIGLGDESGFELARRLVDVCAQPVIRVVLISTRAEDDYADMIATSAAVGFLSKSDISAPALRELLGDRGA
jgi:two-component system nitrate/nitrite response regulator NarL